MIENLSEFEEGGVTFWAGDITPDEASSIGIKDAGAVIVAAKWDVGEVHYHLTCKAGHDEEPGARERAIEACKKLLLQEHDIRAAHQSPDA